MNTGVFLFVWYIFTSNMKYHGAFHQFRTSRHLIFEMICESTKIYAFSNLNQPARLHINLYFFLIQTTLQLRPLAIFFSLKNMCFRRICSWGVNAIRLVRVVSFEPVRVETESMNFSEDSMFYKLYI